MISRAEFLQHINRLARIGIALSSEQDLSRLLELIVDAAREFAGADGGTLYILENDRLHFKILQNGTLGIRKGGTGDAIELPPVPLSKANVSAYVALTGESVNIPDVYKAEGFDFTGPKKYDQVTGYRSASMLVVPMRTQEGDTIGVLQLLNAKDPATGAVVPFSDDFMALTQSLASQAAVAIINARLFADMERLFESFVSVITTAIDERSPYTAGHIRRVADLAVLFCEVITKSREGRFAEVEFDNDRLKEILMAGWLHDIGKITTPVHVVDKSTKLETIFDRLAIIHHRFQLIEESGRAAMLEKKCDLLAAGGSLEGLAEEFEEFRRGLWDDYAFIEICNKGGEFMEEARLARLKAIAARTYRYGGGQHPWLLPDELENLSIRKGTLSDKERTIIQDHVVLTIKMLEKIPFTKKLERIPLYAGTHHEMLHGRGYPKGMKGDEIPLEGRILAIVDIFEALTASDRPYRPPMSLEKAYSILRAEAKAGALDNDLVELFIRENVHGLYRTLHPEHKDPMVPEPARNASAALAIDLVRRALKEHDLEGGKQ